MNRRNLGVKAELHPEKESATVAEYQWTDLPAEWALHSHGHVAPRPDGFLARCGGSKLCEVCQLEKHYLKLLESFRQAVKPKKKPSGKR